MWVGRQREQDTPPPISRALQGADRHLHGCAWVQTLQHTDHSGMIGSDLLLALTGWQLEGGLQKSMNRCCAVEE